MYIILSVPLHFEKRFDAPDNCNSNGNKNKNNNSNTDTSNNNSNIDDNCNNIKKKNYNNNGKLHFEALVVERCSLLFCIDRQGGTKIIK